MDKPIALPQAAAPATSHWLLCGLIGSMPLTEFMQTGVVAFNAGPVMGSLGASPEEYNLVVALYAVVAIGMISHHRWMMERLGWRLFIQLSFGLSQPHRIPNAIEYPLCINGADPGEIDRFIADATGHLLRLGLGCGGLHIGRFVPYLCADVVEKKLAVDALSIHPSGDVQKAQGPEKGHVNRENYRRVGWVQ